MDLERIVLDMAGDDYVGLWEFVWHVQASSVSDVQSAILPSLGATIAWLLHLRALELFRGTSFSGDEVPVGQDIAGSILATELAWTPARPGEMHYRVGVTATGRARYYALGAP